ncbi:MAG: glucose-1-phosphate thymidylyltransferase [Chloroflexi bacterium]|nr:glucose-1-phosphate thymidylyltransferase [Chloroflexota bacterium]|tara:strand:- start:2204 stop:3265 length:1062 start_codon:yes stop_codon:yes gene_type:complete
MKALILVGGLGTRLKPITDSMPKHLIPLGNRPLIFYVFDKILDSGIQDIGLVVSPNNKDFFQDSLDEYDKELNISIIVQERPLGVAHAVSISKDFLGDENFLLYLGDNLFEDDLKVIVDDFKKDSADASIVLKKVENPSSFGVAERNESGVVFKVLEKPTNPPTDLAVVGIYCFTPIIHKAIAQIKPSGRGELEITDAIQYLLDNKFVVLSNQFTGWWLDCGTFDDLLLANKEIIKSKLSHLEERNVKSSFGPEVILGDNSKIIDSIFKGPCIIGDNCLIENSIIEGNTSIQSNSIVINSKVENSILMGNVKIKNLSLISDSIIGKNCDIKSLEKGKSIAKLILGNSTEKIIK